MSDQLDPIITQLIADGRARVDQERAALKAKQDSEADKRQAQIDAQIAGLRNTVMALLPEALRSYCGLMCDDSEPLDGWQYARLEIPGCSPITISVDVCNSWDNTTRENGEYVRITRYAPVNLDSHRQPLFQVAFYQLAFDDDNGVYSVIEHTERRNETHYGSDDIYVALALAAECWLNLADLETQARIKTTEVQAKRAAQQAKASAVTERATAERDALLDLLSDDPVLLALLKVAVALKRERAGYAETIENLADTLETQSERHAQRLADKERETDRAVRQAKDDTDRAQREADDLQSKLTRLKRDAQFA